MNDIQNANSRDGDIKQSQDRSVRVTSIVWLCWISITLVAIVVAIGVFKGWFE